MIQTKTVYIRNEKGEFVCPDCGITKARQNTMFYHMKKHTGELPHKCVDCDKSFLQKSGLHQHRASAHPESTATDNPYAGRTWGCPFCDHSCRVKSNMLIHVARKHAESWIPAAATDNTCGCCSKSFGSPTAYYYHALQCFTPPPEQANAIALLRTTA